MAGFHFNITMVLIALNTIVFFATSSNPVLLKRMLFITNRVKYYKEYDRLFLSGFAHANIIHLALNCVTLFYIGQGLEPIIGKMLFLVLYLAAIVGGNLYCMFMRKEEHSYSALGASGGVLGVIYGFILMNPTSRLLLFILPIPIPAWLFGILFTLISIALTQTKRAEQARISHEGHLGGALVGALVVLTSGKADIGYNQNIYFLAGGVAPIVLFMLAKWLVPDMIYKHLR